MRLACLMAGCSQRLLPFTATHHQACLLAGKDRIIDYQLRSFDRAGIGHKTFVLGHGAAELSAILFALLRHSHVVLLNNPLHHVLNLDWSALLVLSRHDGPVIYYEGDLLIPPSLLRQLSNHPAEICLAIDSDSLAPGRTVRIATTHSETHAGLLIAGRGSAFIPGQRVAGRFITLLKLSDAARHFVVEQLSALPFEGEVQLYHIFERAFCQFSTALIDTAGRPWLRVDSADNLQRAATLAEEIVNA
ncbi:nucleotidyltransferase [Erwinia sp. V71]|uniref:nucleotidyltransferase n=1 Tax=Erwinia sp. V71 TaxID=3369424 RepID=UPI003F5DF434